MTKPTIHAKHISLIITAGTEDRDQSIQDLISNITAAVEHVPGVKNVINSGSYYILDGRVCMPTDYDPVTQNFKPDTHPPEWAGGPRRSQPVERWTPPTYGRSPASFGRPAAPKPKTAAGIDAALEAVRAAKADQEDTHEHV